MNENSAAQAAASAGGAAAGGGGGAVAASDIDMSFLQQFSCMGTTDHEELVRQLQRVIGGPMSSDTAKFFLEMNNWNLQGAVGSYFDFHFGVRLPSMRQISAGLGQAVTMQPQTQYNHSWHVQNNGDDMWPAGCHLRCTVPFQSAAPSLPMNVPVEPLAAGDTTVLTVPLRSPATNGCFRTQWQLATSNGSIFGDILWAIVQVEGGADEAEVAMSDGQLEQQQQTVSSMSVIPMDEFGVSAPTSEWLQQLPQPQPQQQQLPQPQPEQSSAPEDAEMC